jgi:uncharacterized protein (TIGR02217 family)
MSYHNVLWPFGFGEGSSGGPETRTRIATQPSSGAESRVQQWQNPRWRYQVSLANRTPDQLRAIQAFLVARRGRLNAFKVRDPLDFTTAATWNGAATALDVELGIGDGVETRFQMIKVYGSDGYPYSRPLRRPRAGTILVKVNGIADTSWTLDPATGELVFPSPITDGYAVTAGCEFDVVVRADLSEEWARWAWAGGHALAMESLALIEDLDPSPVLGDFFAGGSTAVSMATTVVAVSPSVARLWRITPNGASRRIILPNPLDIPDGIDILRLHNAGPQTMTIEDHLGGSLGSLASATTAFVDLLLESDGDKTWMVAVS